MPVILHDEEIAERVPHRDEADTWCAARESFVKLYHQQAPSLLSFLLARFYRTNAEDLQQTIWNRLGVPSDGFKSALRARFR